jgi:hypothetical protein
MRKVCYACLLLILLNCKDKEPNIRDIVVGTYDLPAVYLGTRPMDADCVKPFTYLFEENGKLNFRIFCPSSSTDKRKSPKNGII